MELRAVFVTIMSLTYSPSVLAQTSLDSFNKRAVVSNTLKAIVVCHGGTTSSSAHCPG